MRKYMERSVIIMVSVLVLSGCSSQKAVPSLEDAGNMIEEEFKQELSKFSREEIHGTIAVVEVNERHIDVYMPFGNSEEWVRFDTFGREEPSVVKTYEVTDPELAFENDELVTMVKYYEMSDGTWKTNAYTYQYRLEITGRMGTAVKDTTFVFLSNIKDITFEQAWKASGLSSNMDDYFKEEDAKFVAMR